MKITLTLVVITIAIFLFSLSNFDYYIENYGFNADNFLSGRYETIITAMFLHGSFLHLASNMVALLFLGGAVESKVRSWQYILVYFAAGIAGSLSLFVPIFGYDASTIAIGASGAISGLIGLGTFTSPGKLTMFPFIIPIPFVIAGALYFLSTSALLFATEDQVAYPAHLFGIAVGAIVGLVWSQQRVKNLIMFILIVAMIIALPYILQLVFG
ncbi:MAG TPA: rhomboid family intramembrane serine protease [archaeon]|nr:rhomboid family intramembrane serine protease [archaeon]